MRKRHGVSMVETMMVMVIVGVLLGIIVPRYGKITNAMSVHSAKQEVASILAQGRATAIQTGRTVQVVRASNVISLVTDYGAGNVYILQQDLSKQFGVTYTADKDTVAYDSRGLVTGNTATLKFIVTDGTTRDSVCLMALGKVSPTGCSL